MNANGNGRVILVGWDSAHWGLVTPLLDKGELPYLGALLHEGVMGTLTSINPVMEPMVYSSTATGKLPDKHGFLGTHELYDHGQAIRPATGRLRRAKAFWDILSQNDVPCHVIGHPCVEPAEAINGTFVAGSFFHQLPINPFDMIETAPGSVLPADRQQTLQEFLVAVNDLDAQTFRLFVQRLEDVDEADKRMEILSRSLIHALSVHSVTTWLMEETDWRVVSVNYSPIELLSREFLKFHAPRLDWVDQKDFDLFHDVINSSVRLCDLLLGRLVHLAGEDASVIVYSPRAYVPHTMAPPGPMPVGPRAEASQHRPHGMLVLKAPGSRKDELIHGARAVDVCPTVLHLAGVAVGQDMDGRFLKDAFADSTAEPQTVDTWETVSPKRPDLDEDMQPVHWGEMLSLHSPYHGRPAARVQAEHDWNLAEVYVNTGRPNLSLPLLTRMFYINPFRTDNYSWVAGQLYGAGLVDEAVIVMRTYVACHPDTPTGQFLAGMIALTEGKEFEAIDYFEAAAAEKPPIPLLFYYMGEVQRRMRRLPRAIEAYHQAIEMNPNLVSAYLGLSRAHDANGDSEAAVDAALQALTVDFSNPMSHVMLGRALEKMDETDRARQAYQTALRYEPEFPMAIQSLAAMDKGPKPGPSGEDEPIEDDLAPIPGPSRWEIDDYRLGVQGARREVMAWANQYIHELQDADGKIMAYLASNAEAQGKPAPSGVLDIDRSKWVIRPVLPADLGQLGDLAARALMEPYEHEILVLHQPEDDQLIGAVAIRMTDPIGQGVSLIVKALSATALFDTGLDEEALWSMLIRAAVARAAAAGAKSISITVPAVGNELAEQRLTEHGFEISKNETTMAMGMAKTRDFCRGLIERYERRKPLPDDVRPVQLKDVPLFKVDRFFRKFFEDGVGPKRLSLSPEISLMIMKGDEIIGGYVGYPEGDMFVSSRFAVDEEYQGTWVAALLLWKGPAI
ncbi:MAG: tetratricopeptide repeat protein, partial [Planctomycetota bacterium]